MLRAFVSLALAAGVLGLPGGLAHIGHISSAERPFELVVHRDPETFECLYAALKETQVYRGLPEAGYFDVSTTAAGEERLRFIHRDAGTVRARLHTLCDNKLSEDFVLFMDDHMSTRAIQDGPQAVLSPGVSGRKVSPPALEVEPLSTSGESSNRVDLVFFSDGYTIDEKEKFLDDAKRLADDITNNQTFNTVKPLMNFWAAFSPSKETGIGIGGTPKNTPFGLYRDGTELRGVYYSKPEIARAACFSMGDQCDYPILMGNDPLYGGLGGEFTVITPSLANGPLVLRHELGHSVIDVGEEYDGGYAYSGVNAEHDVSEGVSWSHWLSNSSGLDNAHGHLHSASTRVERSVMPMQAYPWTMLNVSTPWSVKFSASGLYSRHLVRFSLSGLPSAQDLSVELDGESLPWEPQPGIGVDRWHYDIHRAGGLSDGVHELRFALTNEDREGIAQLCSAEILEFGDEDEFVPKSGYYGVFPTFSDTNETSYRPTNEDCLMRIVTTPNFCKVCLEGLWLSLLRRVDLIDSVSVNASCGAPPSASPTHVQAKATIDLSLVPLAQFREEKVEAEESYTVIWTKDGEVLEKFANKTSIEISGDDALGAYMVDVRFTTAEVHVDKDNLLTSRAVLVLADSCQA